MGFIPFMLLFMVAIWLFAGIYNLIKLEKVAEDEIKRQEKKAKKKGKVFKTSLEQMTKKIRRQSIRQLILGVFFLIILGPRFSVGLVENSEVDLIHGNTDSSGQYNTIITEYVDDHKMPGLVVGIVDGDEQYLFVVGQSGINQNEYINGDTLFEIGSISKVFTAMMLAKNIENNTMSLDDPVSEYIDLDTKSLVFEEITLKELTTHTSGLPRLPSSLGYNLRALASGFSGGNPYAICTEAYIANIMENAKDIKDKEWSYSNYGVGILGMCIGEANNSTYEEMLSEFITEPFGMDSTSVLYDENDADRHATGYRGYFQIGPFAMGFKNAPWLMADGIVSAGGIRSTGNDMLNLLQVIVDQDQEFMNETMKPIVQIDDNWSIGMNWIIDSLEGEDTLIWHDGITGGFHSYIGTYEDSNVGVFVIANSLVNVEDLSILLLEELNRK